MNNTFKYFSRFTRVLSHSKNDKSVIWRYLQTLASRSSEALDIKFTYLQCLKKILIALIWLHYVMNSLYREAVWQICLIEKIANILKFVTIDKQSRNCFFFIWQLYNTKLIYTRFYQIFKKLYNIIIFFNKLRFP